MRTLDGVLKKTKPKNSLLPESVTQLYRRMAQAYRSSPPPPNAVPIALLSQVAELHHHMAAAIQAAVGRSDPGGRQLLLELSTNETDLAQAVGELVVELGGSLPQPEESFQEFPRAMSRARDQGELLAFLRENLEWVARAHLELDCSTEIPATLRQRLAALRVTSIRNSSS